MSTSIRRQHIFLSYAREDRDFVDRMIADLTRVGLRVWIDRHDLVAGTPNWDRAVRAAISRAYIVLLVASPSARKSDAVHGEITIAREQRRRVLPVWAVGERWSDCVPISMINAQRLDCRGPLYDKHVTHLIGLLSPVSSSGLTYERTSTAVPSLISDLISPSYEEGEFEEIDRFLDSDELPPRRAHAYASMTEYKSQDDCEREIVATCRGAKTIKILTIRGERYFVGQTSLLKRLCDAKTDPGYSTQVLVLSPDSAHITDDLAQALGKSADEVRAKMRMASQFLALSAVLNPTFEVRMYESSPCFKLLFFDDVVFISSFAGRSKNDSNEKMASLDRENPLFAAFERHFDLLWMQAAPLEFRG